MTEFLRILLVFLLLLAGCAGSRSVPHSPINYAQLSVRGNSSFVGTFVLSVLTLGLLPRRFDRVVITSINGNDVNESEIRLRPGFVNAGVTFKGKGGIISKGVLYLPFDAQPGATYVIRWKADSLQRRWSASILEEDHKSIIVGAKGDLFIPDPAEENPALENDRPVPDDPIPESEPS